MKFKILHERPGDDSLIEPLLDRCFGFDRHHKTVYRLREGVAPIDKLSFVALAPDGGLLGSLRFWPIRIGAAPASLLGPLAVEPALQGAGVGRGPVAPRPDPGQAPGRADLVRQANWQKVRGCKSPGTEGVTEPRFSASRASVPVRGQAKRR